MLGDCLMLFFDFAKHIHTYCSFGWGRASINGFNLEESTGLDQKLSDVYPPCSYLASTVLGYVLQTTLTCNNNSDHNNSDGAQPSRNI